MSLLQTLLNLIFLFAMAVGLTLHPMEGRWFLQSYHNPKPTLLYTTCHSAILAFRIERAFDASYSVVLDTGENVIKNYIGVLTVPQPKQGPIDVFAEELTGGLSYLCRVIDMTISKSGNTIKAFSNCHFDAVCVTKSTIPTAGELNELEELCPGFTKIDNSNC